MLERRGEQKGQVLLVSSEVAHGSRLVVYMNRARLHISPLRQD